MFEQARNRVMHASREEKFRHFYSLAREGQSILDVGVSAESKDPSPLVNMFLKRYEYAPGTYTGLGVEDLSGMAEKYPGKTFLAYGGCEFPFRDKQFDWAFSNAVIEHVGGERDQIFFLNELLRVSKNVFFTTPNKYFPIESHTNFAFLHWNDKLFYTYAKKKGMHWINKENLSLFSRSHLEHILSQSNVIDYKLQNNRLLGLTMTFTVVCASS